MSREFPNSFKDPLYAELDARTEQKLGLPPGLLSAIRLRGERSNNDQVSEAQARSPYQFIPATRKAIEEKYGIDPLLSPQNASEAAGLLLKESLARNAGDAALAVAEYHGGTDRKNWGPRTRAYVQRVVGRPIEESVTATVDLPATAPKSTFTRVAEQRAATQPDTQALSKVFAAYKEGRMSAQQAAEFEKDVRDGLLMLPQGMTLKGTPSRQAANMLPVSVITAYQQGRMSPQQKAELEQDVASGIVALPEGMTLTQTGISSAGMIPSAAPGDVAPAATQPVSTAPQSIGQQIVGAGETALALGTGATGGIVGGAAGLVGGLAGQILQGNLGTPEGANAVEQAMMRGMQAGTYAPRTEAGQQQMQAVGGALQNLPPVVGVAMAPGAVQPALAAVAPVSQAATTAARALPQVVRQRMTPVREAFSELIAKKDDSVFGAGSVGAAETADAAVRREIGAQMPVPFEGESALTRGQATRDFAQLQFEKEAAKRGDTGAPLRERVENQSEVLLQNWDALVDRANPVTLDARELGKLVDRAVVNKANFARKRTDAAYAAAREAGEMEAPVQMDALAQRLQSLERFEGVATNLAPIRREAARLGAIAETEGQIVGNAIKLNDSELLRQFVNEATDWTDKRQALMARRVNEAIDASTETAGGELYRKARKLRQEYAQEFENVGLTKRLLGTKGKTDERAVALDDVFRRIIVDAPLEELNKVRRTLLTEGQVGREAWQSLKAKTIDNIKESALSASQRDSRGNALISPDKLAKSIQALDREGKLESLFGKKQAQTMRDLADIAGVIYTAPPSAINSSNTASALQVALDSVATFGVTGIPAPAVTALREASKYLKNRDVAKRITEALSDTKQPTKSRF